MQTRGLNAMSYADISARVGITNASLHYHFPAKADLAVALVDRYSERSSQRSTRSSVPSADDAERLRAYVDIYAAVLARGRMCLCGMLASDFETLSGAVQERVSEFFERNYVWLERVIDRGVADGRLTAPASSRASAEALVAGLEGADARAPDPLREPTASTRSPTRCSHRWAFPRTSEARGVPAIRRRSLSEWSDNARTSGRGPRKHRTPQRSDVWRRCR